MSSHTDLVHFKQWILWKWSSKNGRKATKIPVDPNSDTLRFCNAQDPAFWMSANEMMVALKGVLAERRVKLNVGFVLTESDPFVCIDLDGCRDPENGFVWPWAGNIVDRFQSYTEISPSGTGLKIFVRSTDTSICRIRKDICVDYTCEKTPAIEVFSKRQFVAITAQRYKFGSIEDRTEIVRQLIEEYGPSKVQSEADRKFRDNPDADAQTVADAREFLSTFPAAVSGNGGHNITFAAACRLIIDYALSSDQALELLQEWNETCIPPWELHELRHKIQGAGQQAGERGLKTLAGITADFKDVIASFETLAESPTETHGHVVADQFVPFPVEALPAPLQRFINAVSSSIGCDPSFVALPVLAVCASAIGNSRVLQAKKGWCAPSILWTAIVGESGTQKTPALSAALKPLKKQQALWSIAHQISEAEIDRTSEKSTIQSQSPPTPETNTKAIDPLPVSKLRRCVVADVTVEALAPLLSENPNGLLLARDELSGWFAGFDQYKNKSAVSADAAKWLSLYSADSITVDRKSGPVRYLHVPQGAVSVCGGIQPGILNTVIGTEHRESGLLARLLFSCPPRRKKQWSEATISATVENEYESLVTHLLNVRGTDGCHGSAPQTIKLADDAKQIYIKYVNSTGEEQFSLTGERAAAWSKLEETAARLALVIHCCRQALNDVTQSDVCDAASMQSGVILATWFKNETRRVYSMMSETKVEKRLRELSEWIRHKGGQIRGRELVSAKKAKNMPDAEKLLTELVEAGFGIWSESSSVAGPKARVFMLKN
jgi:hypothetical protein